MQQFKPGGQCSSYVDTTRQRAANTPASPAQSFHWALIGGSEEWQWEWGRKTVPGHGRTPPGGGGGSMVGSDRLNVPAIDSFGQRGGGGADCQRDPGWVDGAQPSDVAALRAVGLSPTPENPPKPTAHRFCFSIGGRSWHQHMEGSTKIFSVRSANTLPWPSRQGGKGCGGGYFLVGMGAVGRSSRTGPQQQHAGQSSIRMPGLLSAVQAKHKG